MLEHHINRESGLSLAEVLVAGAILAGALVTLGHLFVLGARGGDSARVATSSATLAAQKLEDLRSGAWGVDELGNPFGELPQPGADYLDRSGNVLGIGPLAPAGAAFYRRWLVEPVASHPGVATVFRVTAGRVRPAGARTETRQQDEAWLVTATTRKAR